MYDLSIIIPHYNTPRYLKELLLTIPALDNIQVLVIDDKSDKDLEEYCAIKTDSKFSHVAFLDNTTDKKNAGTCRNIGLQHAKGKWLLFADADDLFAPGFYDAVSKYFTSGYDAIFFVPTSADRDTMELSTRHLDMEMKVLAYRNTQSLRNELRLRYEIDSPWSKMISHDFVRRHNINFNEVIAANDSAFSTKVGYYMKSFATSEEIIYCATNNTGSLTKTVSEEIYDARLGELIWKLTFLRERMDKKEYRILGLCAAEYLYKVVKYGFGLKKLLGVFKLLRGSKTKIISARLFNLSDLRIKRASSKNSKRFIVRSAN